jgi:uncharacterized membrane protein
VRKIGFADLRTALARGYDDFKAMPTHVVFLCVVYPFAGLLIATAALGNDFLRLLYPLAAGFALLGPFFAIGLYELSRRREAGLDTNWKHAFDVVHSPSLPAILALGLLLLAIFGVWIATADAIYVAFFGYRPINSPLAFLGTLFSTREGLGLIVVGNVVGLGFAIVAGTLSVVSFPLLLDRHVGFAAAILASLRLVAANPVTMAAWGLIVAAILFIASLPLFVGLAIALPILGHATWHLYRLAIEPDPGARPEFHTREGEPRYAADFPVNLIAPLLRGKKE